jgi:hypothetical protein
MSSLCKRRTDSTHGHSANSIRTFRRVILILGLAAIATFVVGPQLGSVDADGDGFPEVLVVVASTSPCTRVSRSALADSRPQSIDQTVALMLMAVQAHALEIDQSELLLHSNRCVKSLVLRC